MRDINSFYQKQREYGYIKAINVSRDIRGDECSRFDLRLSLTKFPCWDVEDSLEILFEGVSNLKIGDIDNLLQISLQISSISDYQREDEKYIVNELENELFSFACRKIIF